VQAGGTVKVAKNRLAKIALQGTDFRRHAGSVQGTDPDLLFGDPVVAPKVASDFAKGNDNLVILGGAMGETNLDPMA
jgi:large subunit ribosomal protein L10